MQTPCLLIQYMLANLAEIHHYKLKKGVMISKIKEKSVNHNLRPTKCTTPEKDVIISHSDT